MSHFKAKVHQILFLASVRLSLLSVRLLGGVWHRVWNRLYKTAYSGRLVWEDHPVCRTISCVISVSTIFHAASFSTSLSGTAHDFRCSPAYSNGLVFPFPDGTLVHPGRILSVLVAQSPTAESLRIVRFHRWHVAYKNRFQLISHTKIRYKVDNQSQVKRSAKEFYSEQEVTGSDISGTFRQTRFPNENKTEKPRQSQI